MTTKEAFALVINERGAWKKIEGMNDSTFRALRKSFLDGKVITIDKMEEILEKAGYKVVQEKLWRTGSTKDIAEKLHKEISTTTDELDKHIDYNDTEMGKAAVKVENAISNKLNEVHFPR